MLPIARDITTVLVFWIGDETFVNRLELKITV